MKVGQLMKSGACCCNASDSLMHAARIMWDYDCGCVVVKDDAGRVAGMLTDRDVCMAAYLRDARLSSVPVSSAMSQEVFSCAPADSVADAAAIMRAHQVRRLPVLDESGDVVGVLSLNDIAGEAKAQAKRSKKVVTLNDVGETLRAVCKPRDRSLVVVGG